MKKIVVVLASLIVVACASSPKTNTSQPSQPSEQNAASASSAKIDPVSVASAKMDKVSAAEIELHELTARIEALQKKSDYFDYAKYAIKPEYLGVLEKEAAFIKAHKNDFVTLEGNADERGSDEYNLSLGEKRAAAVQKSLVKYGVPANQVKLVTLGKQKPRLTCHEEKCWKENRRVDFMHKLS